MAEDDSPTVADSQDQLPRLTVTSPAQSPQLNDVISNNSGPVPKLDTESRDESRDASRAASSGRASPDVQYQNAPSPGAPTPSGHSSQSQLNNGERRGSEPTIDPLSEQIMKRTNVQIPGSTLRHMHSPTDGAPVPLSASTTGTFLSDTSRTDSMGTAKEKKKGVSFLSRFMSTKKKDTPEKFPEFDADFPDERPEGMDAELFTQPLDNIGFSPHHLKPPGYIKVRSHNKKEKEFDRLFLAQELRCRERISKSRQSSASNIATSRRTRTMNKDAVWAMEFSKDGRFLAAGGQDKVVRVWAVLSSREERHLHELAENAREEAGGQHMRLSAPVFQSKPIREYDGHTAAVLDVSWSKNNFLLSSSMDKTVRLWHSSRAECLCAFKHNDLVTSIQFHPRDDRFFLAGCLDSKIRLWSIPDKSVAFWNQVPDMITAVAFTPDGKYAIAGCQTGLCLFYETEGMKYQTQVHVKSSHGKNAKGSKITGIQASMLPPGSSNGDIKLLITSNDSRIRLYNLRDKSLEMKFKGNQNASMQIHARFSDDARYIICGSDDHKAYVWSTTNEDIDKNKRPVEMFEAHSTTTTVALFAPRKTRQLLGYSEDPIYDLCNPPPVTLVSKSEVDSLYSFQGGPEGAQPATPNNPDGSHTPVRPEYSAAYIARSAHMKGNIIVTADAAGVIKVFRQDCAHEKRNQSAADEASLFTKRSGTSIIRKSSMATYVTNHSHPRSRSRQNSTASQPSVDRVLSWRQSISGSNASLERSSSVYLQGVASPTGRGQTRSNSPKKSLTGIWNRSPNASGNLTRQGSLPMTGASSPSPRKESASSPSIRKSSADTESSTHVAQLQRGDSTSDVDSKQQHPSHLLDPSERPDVNRVASNVYWRRDAWKEGMADQIQSINQHRMSDVAAGRPNLTSRDTLELPLSQRPTHTSALSSEMPSDASDASDGGHAAEPAAAVPPPDLVCSKCGGRGFRPRHRESIGVLGKGDTVWACARCGTVHE